MNRCRNSSGLRWNISKHCFEIITRSRLWSTVSKRGTHPDSFFIPNCSCKNWNHCAMWYVCGLNKRSCTFTCRSVKTISWTLSMISGVAASIERPERGASYVDVRPRLNLFTQLQSWMLVQMCYEHYPTRFWFLLVNFSYVDVWSLHETRFFLFCKKYKGYSL